MGELHGSLRPNPCVNIVGLSSFEQQCMTKWGTLLTKSHAEWSTCKVPYVSWLWLMMCWWLHENNVMTTWRRPLVRAVEQIPRWEALLCHACFLPPNRFKGTAANWPWAPPLAVWIDKDWEHPVASNFISERAILWMHFIQNRALWSS